MLTIKNRMNLKDYIVKDNQILYVVVGVYEYPDEYQIHLRSHISNPNPNIKDELIILKRNLHQAKELGGPVWTYYDMYDNKNPKHRNGLTIEALRNRDSVLKVMQHILSKNK